MSTTTLDDPRVRLPTPRNTKYPYRRRDRKYIYERERLLDDTRRRGEYLSDEREHLLPSTACTTTVARKRGIRQVPRHDDVNNYFLFGNVNGYFLYDSRERLLPLRLEPPRNTRFKGITRRPRG